MTDEEVKKGLECCLNLRQNNYMCDECPYTNDCFGLDEDALALIKRLEEEKDLIGKKTASDILLQFAPYRAASPALSKKWYALAEQYGVTE